ncbi:MAG TPA: hypothetical protein VIG73_10605 [Cerasibacillus sp.]|uniref:hypothetical protein n=1 Tax=Cerasibacillus sp. TaxID=2498711 RepID=UPI002F3FC202
MAGYIFSLNSIGALTGSIYDGIYSTNLKLPKNNYWSVHHEGTFADYITMKDGDNVFFFHQRKIYGIGELITVKGDCKLLNFPDADFPSSPDFSKIKNDMILNHSPENLRNRMLCTFKGKPYFFKNGVDMDEVLRSNPTKFKMLRAFEKLSFIKIDEEENKALIDIILKNNEENLFNKSNLFITNNKLHKRINNLVNKKYKVTSENILDLCKGKDGQLKHEMAIETGVLEHIIQNKGTFGRWDYVSHQVIASPFKPVIYMDKMDIFGYRFIPGYDTVSKYLVLEIKKGPATKDDIIQVMKYVDWVNKEYSYEDYNMIKAFLVAYDFPPKVIQIRNTLALRNYLKGFRPPISKEWSNLRLIKYRYIPERKELAFCEA